MKELRGFLRGIHYASGKVYSQRDMFPAFSPEWRALNQAAKLLFDVEERFERYGHPTLDRSNSHE